MALRRPALEAGRLSIRRVPLPRYKLGSQICSISVSCALSDGNQAGRELSSEPEPMGRQNEKGSCRLGRDGDPYKEGAVCCTGTRAGDSVGVAGQRWRSMRSSTEQKKGQRIKIRISWSRKGRESKTRRKECAEEKHNRGGWIKDRQEGQTARTATANINRA